LGFLSLADLGFAAHLGKLAITLHLRGNESPDERLLKVQVPLLSHSSVDTFKRIGFNRRGPFRLLNLVFGCL
jgi:hypothetical protein